MAIEPDPQRITAVDILKRKGGEPIVALTAYHAHTAAILDEFVDFMLVGDSLGMVMHGLKTTLPVTLEMMILQGQAVMRGSKRALVVVDLPFGSYEESPAAAFRSAVRVIKETGCGAVKVEGGSRMAETIRFVAERGIPVMAHVGLMPQSVNTMGGFKIQGRDAAGAEAVKADARAVADAGAFAVVVEGIVEPLAREVTAAIPIPTIGIGASAECDGQILVLEDMLGLSPNVPKFVKPYGQLAAHIRAAVDAYTKDVRSRAFPDADHVYKAKK